jgi:hypothetical protein
MERAVQSQIGTKCYTAEQVTAYDGVVDINPNGVVSVYLPNNVGVLAPVQLTSECCKILGSQYFFDIDSQKCRWAPVVEDACALKNPFKLVLNPKGNDGTIFYVDEGQTCELSIDFNYLFKVKCETLSEIINPKAVAAPIDPKTAETIKYLENEIQGILKECGSYSEQIKWYQTEIANTPYSIICDGKLTTTKSVYEKVVPSSLTNFKRTGFGSAPFAFDLEDYTNTTLCLTDPDGLSAWATILGTVNYQAFLNGDINSFTCENVSAIITQNFNNSLLSPAGPVLFEVCDVPFGTKTDLIKKLNELLILQENCTRTINGLETELTTLTTTTQETNSACKTPIEFFETFNVSATLDVVTGGTVQTVATFDLFNTIGNGQLYNYLVAHPDNSGFYVCGDNDVDTTCTPLTLDINGTNTGICDEVMNNLLTSLYDESGLSGTTNGQDTFNTTLPFNSLASKWLHFNVVVTDPAIIDLITNQKIKISFEINHACGDFCVLVDEIVLDKKCTQVTHNNIFLTQAPGFELDRIRDNKKSWIANTTPVNRPFVISNNLGGQSIRQTNYDVNDERLVINSKEIDLDINIASAIETDVWCYISDNPCLLTGVCVYTTATTTAMTFSETNLIVNGTFDVSLSGWTLDINNNWGWNAGWADYQGADEGGYLQQTALTVGNTYKVTFDLIYATPITGLTSDITVSLGTNTTPFNYSAGTYNIEFTGVCSGTGVFRISGFDNSGAGLVYLIDNVVVLEGVVTTSTTITSSCCDPCSTAVETCGNKQFQDDECFYFMDSQVYEFMDGDFIVTGETSLNGSNCCGDEIDFSALLTQPLSAVTTIEDFDYFLTSELIDAKNRQTLSGYPTLRALYDRYMNSGLYCGNESSKFDYITMDQFAGLIDNYWVDIVEQVVPATTIWGSVKVYSNTLFDQQKFKYKSYSSLFCENQFEGTSLLSPINGATGQCANVEVIITPLNIESSPNARMKNPTTICDSICIAQMNSGSEFVGTVSVIKIRLGGIKDPKLNTGSEGIGLGHGSYTVIENLEMPK